MSEPINLYDRNGKLHVMHSPRTAHEMVVAGWLFVEPPAQPVAPLEYVAPPEGYAAAPLDNWTGVNLEDVRFVVTYTPDNTQDVPVVPTGRARRKSSGNSGVL